VGGVLLILSGGTGAVAMIRLGWSVVAALSPALGDVLAPLFVAVLLIAALGGGAVVIGAHLLEAGHRRTGKLLIALGAGAGLLGLVLHLAAVAFAGGNPMREMIATALTMHGAGSLLAIYARMAG